MNGRWLLAAMAVVLGGVLGGTALGAGSAKNPKVMVLQKSDFPAGARVVNKYTSGASSAAGAGYYVTYRYTSGSKTRELGSFASTWNSSNLARLGFRELKTDVPKTKLVLPKYGDEQLAGGSCAWMAAFSWSARTPSCGRSRSSTTSTSG
jgi:hypothetical protein